jgi:protein-S-isoprenylcysteine O-methyltransferase Ste14
MLFVLALVVGLAGLTGTAFPPHLGYRPCKDMTFRRAGTHINPGEPATTLVTTGPYRLSRNPGYLGMAFAYSGIAVLSGALWALALLLPTLFLIDRGVIRREERYLERTFGDEYLRYRSRTRRWI